MAGADLPLAVYSIAVGYLALHRRMQWHNYHPRRKSAGRQPGHSPNPKPISFGICSRFVSAPSKLKSDANLFRLATSVLLMD